MSAVPNSPSESAQLTSGCDSVSGSRNKTVADPRHSSRCSLCGHPQRRTIENAFVNKTMSVRNIHEKFKVGHDAVYRHAHALNLLPTRNRNWRGRVQSDNSAEVTTEAAEARNSVLHAEMEATPYAKMMLKLLNILEDNQLLAIVERAIEAKAAAENTGIDIAANALFNLAALQRIQRTPDSWPRWFRNKGYEKEV